MTGRDDTKAVFNVVAFDVVSVLSVVSVILILVLFCFILILFLLRFSQTMLSHFPLLQQFFVFRRNPVRFPAFLDRFILHPRIHGLLCK